MITAWMLYAMVVGILLGAGAQILEKLLRTHARASRWVWAGAMILSVAWPLGQWVWGNRPLELPPPPTAVGSPTTLPRTVSSVALPVEPMVVEVPAESALRRLDGPILVGWGLTTGLLLLFFASLFLRTHYLRRGWRRELAGGRPVLVSDEWGPAVVGFFRPQIVLPGWCREMDDRALRFILDHEQEHIRAGDPRLIILAGIIPLLFPWHFPVWWQLARLRAALEGDCDLRVLGRNPGQTKPYIELLLEVGVRAARRRPVAAMLSEPYETLKRRIRIMTTPIPRRPLIRGGLLAGGGGLLVALAGLAPGPVDAQKGESGPPAGADPILEAVSLERGKTEAEGVRREAIGSSREAATRQETALPKFTPFIVNPTIRNQEAVVAALESGYAPLVKDAGIGGMVDVWFFIDEEGTVQRTLVNKTSGHRALDDAAIRIAGLIEFTPALNRDRPSPVWVSLPVEFTVDAGPGAEGLPPSPRGEGAGQAAVTDPPPEEDRPELGRGEVSGVVTDSRSGEPLRYAQLLVSGTGRGALSNQDGRFLIQHVPVGERELFATLVGYGEIRVGVSVREGERSEVMVGLQVTAIAMEPLVVRGSSGVD